MNKQDIRERIMAIPEWLRNELTYLAFMKPDKDSPTFHHNIAVSSERILSELDKARAELADEIDNALDDIQGTATERYYPFMDTESRFSHIDSAVDELRAELKQSNEEDE